MSAATYGYPGRRGRASGVRRARPARPPARRVRWDRLARTALLGVLVAVVYLYLSAGVSLLSTWQEARRTDASVTSLRHEYRKLAAQRPVLESEEWLEVQARRLGMAYPGSRQYYMPGLPNR